MSHNNNRSTDWDLSCFRLDQVPSSHFQSGTHQGRRASPIKDKFIKGPIDVTWLCRASRLGVKALLVGLALWHIKGLRKADAFIVSNLMLREWGIQPDAKQRALRKLEGAGLIRIERRGKRSPQVVLCSSPTLLQEPPIEALCAGAGGTDCRRG
jgi:hypothetical protein